MVWFQIVEHTTYEIVDSIACLNSIFCIKSNFLEVQQTSDEIM